MQKKILSSLLLASALPFNVHALGLGDIEVYSALNQPLDAEITVTSAKPGETESLLIKLASEQAFLKSGVERPFMLTKLKFKSSFKADGTPIIKVTSPKAIREPFLNFLVDVEWPRGRLVREYTILLDPPSFTTRAPATTASPEVTKAAAASTAGSAPIQREPVPAPQETTSVYGFAEPEPTTEPDSVEVVDATYQEIEEEVIAVEETAQEVVVEQQAQVDEVLAYEEPLPNEEIVVENLELEAQDAVVEEVATESDSPFSDLLNDIQEEESVEFDENAFAPTTTPEVAAVTDDYTTPSESVEVDGDIPEINMTLDESIPYNAESILAADNAYIDPEIESLLRGDDTLLYRAPEPEVVVAEPEPVFVEPVEEIRPDTYTVEEGDFMLQIAEQFRPEEVDINQAMLAIMRYNPEAFIQDNVNLVRKGQVLRIPDEEAMRALSQGDALVEVQGQNALWREYRAQLAGSQSQSIEDGTQAATVASDATTDEAAPSDSGTQLALVAPGKDDAGTDFASGEQEGDGELRRLERNLALAKEKLVASNLEQTELQSRIAELEQIATQSEGVINLKNQQLAQIQANAEQANDAAGEVDEAVQEVVADEDAAGDLLSGEGDLLAGIDGVDESIDASEADEATEDTAVEVVQVPVAITEPSAASARPDGLGGIIYDVIPPSLRPSLQPILSGPLLFVVLTAIILLPLILIFLLLRKKKSDEPQIIFEEESPVEEAAAEPADMSEEADDVDATMSLDSADDEFDTEATMVSTVAQTAIEPEAPADAAADDDIQDDTTAEVDVYIAYGLHDQAEELLKQSISDNPDITAYRGKLLETYFNAGKKDEFINEAQELNDYLGGRDSKVWDKAVVMGKEIAPDNMLFSDAEVSGDLKASDFAAAKPDMADLDLGAGEDGADIDLGAADIDLDIGDGEPEQAVADSVEEDEFSLDDVAAELDASMEDDAVEVAGDDELEFDVADFIEESDAAEADVDLSADMDLGDADEESADLDLGSDLDFDMGSDEEADIDLGDDVEADIDLSGLDDIDTAEDDAAEIDMDFDAGDDALDLSDSLEDDLNDAADSADLDADVDLGMDLDDADSLFEESVEEAPAAPEASDDGLDFDMGDLDDLSADAGELSADDTQGLDDSLFDDDADSTQMIDDESLETMIDDIESDAADFGLDDDMPDNLDEVGTKLDLAKAYIDMGDADGAKASLEEVIQEGNDVQKKEAEELLAQI